MESFLRYIESSSTFDKRIIFGSTCEDIFLDFKREFDFASQHKRDIAEEFACDVCQFANTFGGSILIGIEEKYKEKEKLKVASKVYPINNIEKIQQYYNDCVLPLISPHYIDVWFNVINLLGGSILSICIKPLVNTIAAVSSKKNNKYLRFPYRTNYGKKYMSYNDIFRRINSSTREKFLSLLDIWTQNNKVELLSPITKEEKSNSVIWDHKEFIVHIKEVTESYFVLQINDLKINIPYDLVYALWEIDAHIIGLVLLVELVIDKNRKKIILKFKDT